MLPYHNRMPAILHPREYNRWLDREEVERPPIDLLRSYGGDDLVVLQAHPKVGNVRNQGINMLDSQ